MKIALFSDIHANLPALEAFFVDVEKHRPDAIYCLGDLVGYNIWPNEVVHEIRKRRIPTIAGNYDFGIGRNSDDCGCAYKSDEEKANGAISISYTNSIMGDDERAYLKNLPSHINVEFKRNDETVNLLLVHGSPRRINEYLFEDRKEKSLVRILRDANADILCFGHTHQPYHKALLDYDGGTIYRHAINIGSIGKPKDGDNRGCYVLLNMDGNFRRPDKTSIHVEFVRFEYDVEKAAKAVEGSILPNAYAGALRKAH
ncbi:metallophosphoesterase family protein [Flagellimonas crocea]|uniref:metallophosphoesterase family protein n=1 Tax=Flagellimonas crocea TaxID=3067311 RepID=UPI00296E754B|nr:metallophosphoesterase family protein [Muricauda sp. DH64]